jgi:hypothetical protein
VFQEDAAAGRLRLRSSPVLPGEQPDANTDGGRRQKQ